MNDGIATTNHKKLNETYYMRVIIKCNKCVAAAVDVFVEYINTRAPDTEPKLK